MRATYRRLAIALLASALVAGSARIAPAWFGQDNQGGEEEGNGNPAAPEIDPGVLGGGLAVLASGLLILRDRRRAS